MLDMLGQRLRQNGFKTPVFVRHVGLLAQKASTVGGNPTTEEEIIFAESLTRAYQQSNNPQNLWGFEPIFHESTLQQSNILGRPVGCGGSLALRRCWIVGPEN